MNVALSSLIASSSGEKSWKPPIFKHSGQNTEQENEPTEKVARKSTELTSEDTEHLLEGNDLCSKPKKSEINWRAISVVLLYAPMLSAVEYRWETWDMDEPDSYSGALNRETEEAWDRLWQYSSVGIAESKLHLLNESSPRSYVHMPGELGGGVTAFFDGFHQMHCLNLVRQYTYRDQYVYSSLPAFDKSPEKLLSHIEHCIEMLRIDLMCFADGTPYLIKVEENGQELVDATTKHRCRNSEALIDWSKAHVVEPYNATAELIKHKDEHYDHGG